jgi:hypothetical protein
MSPRLTARACALAGVGTLHFAAYLVASRIALARGEAALWDAAIPLDDAIPYLSWTWAFYWLCYPYAAIAGAAAVLPLPQREFRRALAAVAGSILVGAGIHAAFPAPRPTPHPFHPGQALIHWSSLQVPLNTLPSMHTAFAVLIVAFAFAAWAHPLARAAFVLPAVLIVGSTLTLKEHVILDLVAGLALGGTAAAWWARGRSGPRPPGQGGVP